MRSPRTWRMLASICVVVAIWLPGVAEAADSNCAEQAASADNALVVGMTCTGEPRSGGIQAVSTEDTPAYDAYKWSSPCVRFDPGASLPSQADCRAALVCSDPIERLWDLWGHRIGGGWEPLGSRCLGRPPTAADTPQPRITPAMVLNEIRRIGLPKLQAKTQPEGKTLVNFDTIFYTRAQPFAATVTLLGQQVDIVATATEYTWHHGDGTSTTTASPGSPYPSKEITYRYSDADRTVRPRVDVTYTARFRVNAGSWQNIDETVTIAGPETALRVSEAKAVLSGNYG